MGTHLDSSDTWLQNRVTVPCTTAIEKYRNEISVFIEREKGIPKAPTTLRMARKKDSIIKREMELKLRNGDGIRGDSVAKAKGRVFAELFQRDELQPGAFDKHEHIVAKDMERYAMELQFFREVTKCNFDGENVLLSQENYHHSEGRGFRIRASTPRFEDETCQKCILMQRTSAVPCVVCQVELCMIEVMVLVVVDICKARIVQMAKTKLSGLVRSLVCEMYELSGWKRG